MTSAPVDETDALSDVNASSNLNAENSVAASVGTDGLSTV
jgi:hypothetical protein